MGEVTKAEPFHAMSAQPSRSPSEWSDCVWRAVSQGEAVSIELVPDRLFVMHADLMEFMERTGAGQVADSEGNTTPTQPRKCELSLPGKAETAPSADEAPSEDTPRSTAKPARPENQVQSESSEPPPKENKACQPVSMPKDERLLSIKEVVALIGMKESTLYDWLNEKSPRYKPTFPKQIKVGGGRAARWRASEVSAWIDAQGPGGDASTSTEDIDWFAAKRQTGATRATKGPASRG